MVVKHISEIESKDVNIFDINMSNFDVDARNPFAEKDSDYYISDSKQSLLAFIFWLRDDKKKLRDIINSKLYVKLSIELHDRRIRLINYLSRQETKNLVITHNGDKELASIYYKMFNNDIWYNPKAISKIEFVFTTHIPKSDGNDDYHLTKERHILNDGTTRPHIRYVKNYKVPFWVTKQIFRNHEQKKEFEELSKVERHETTVSDFANQIGTKLRGRPYSRNNLRDSRPSPYIYGGDIASDVHMKIDYLEKYGPSKSPMSYCALDTENDTDSGELTAITVAFKRSISLFVTKDLVKNVKGDPVEQIRKEFYSRALQKYDNGTIKYDINELTVDITIADDPAEAVKGAFKQIHKWKPDMVGIWSITHDVPLMSKMLEDRGIRPEDVYCDPSVPKHMRYVKFNQGSLTSPKGTPLSKREQWHTYTIPASYFFIDAMSTYHFVRVGGNQQPGGYGIDNVLDKQLGLGKFKMPESGNLEGKEFHDYMSRNYPILYAVYNIWDTFAMILLDEFTNDISISITPLSVLTPLRYFNSGPRRIVDKLFYDSYKSGWVIGTKDLYNPTPDRILGMSNWIVTLEAFRTLDKGIPVIDGMPFMKTNVTPATSDIDATSSYPSDTVAGNISMATTKTEIISMRGIDKEDFKRENMNIIYGPVNANRYAVNMFGVPDMYEVDKLFKERLKNK